MINKDEVIRNNKRNVPFYLTLNTLARDGTHLFCQSIDNLKYFQLNVLLQKI